jgi:hypothetical protein
MVFNMLPVFVLTVKTIDISEGAGATKTKGKTYTKGMFSFLGHVECQGDGLHRWVVGLIRAFTDGSKRVYLTGVDVQTIGDVP